MTEATRPALHGFTVLELGLAEAGQYCGRLLAALGARVITIEPSDGSPTRSVPPFVLDEAGQRRSIPYEYLNAGKQSIAVDDQDDGALAALLRAFEGHADALVCSPAANRRLPPGLRIPVVQTSLYGSASPRVDVPSTPLTRFQAGGSGSLMPTPRPVAPGTLAGEGFSGAGVALTVLSMLLFRQCQGAVNSCVPRVDHCEQAHLVNLEKMFIGRIAKEGAVVTRESHRYPFGGAVRCRDGFVSMLINEKHQWRGFCEAIGRPDWATDPRFATGSARFRVKDEIEAALVPWCAARTRAEVVEAMRSREVPIGSVNEVGEVGGMPALRQRGFVREAKTPFGTPVVIGLPYGADPCWQAQVRPYAPLPGEHTHALLNELRDANEALAPMHRHAITKEEA